MKRCSWVLLALCLLLTGCVKYRVTLNNGNSFTVLGKPKLDSQQGVYRYKTGGVVQTIPRSRVVSIVPAADDAE